MKTFIEIFNGNSDMFILQIRAVENFADKAIAYLTEYAEKLGVEL